MLDKWLTVPAFLPPPPNKKESILNKSSVIVQRIVTNAFVVTYGTILKINGTMQTCCLHLSEDPVVIIQNVDQMQDFDVKLTHLASQVIRENPSGLLSERGRRPGRLLEFDRSLIFLTTLKAELDMVVQCLPLGFVSALYEVIEDVQRSCLLALFFFFSSLKMGDRVRMSCLWCFQHCSVLVVMVDLSCSWKV